MSIHIDRIEIAKTGLSTCYRCKAPIPEGELRLVGKHRYFHYQREKFYCLNCGRKIIDKLDLERINLQLADNRLNF